LIHFYKRDCLQRDGRFENDPDIGGYRRMG